EDVSIVNSLDDDGDSVVIVIVDEPKEREEIVTVDADICITIPVGTQFQFRTIGHKPLVAVAITIPPWPGDNEAILRQGIWNASFIGIENSSTKLTNSIYQWFIIVTFFIIKLS
ncbi:unnamed protein product, partial [Rotaria sordida]